MAQIARETRRALATLAKYKVLDRWDERRDAIIEQANALQDDLCARRLAEAQAQTADLRTDAIARIRARLAAGTQEITIADIDRLLRVERFLCGEPDSHVKTSGDSVVALRAFIALLDANRADP
jgi:hypothetical protein